MKKYTVSHLVSELVQEVLKTISPPYPENITDFVCLAIEKDEIGWKKRYNQLLEKYGKYSVNSQIGRQTRQLTGFKNLGIQSKATSSLIKTYTRLG